LVGNADPLTLALLRWGIGFLVVLPVTLLLRSKMPPRADWLAVSVLGVCFFGLFFALYNVAVAYTTAARASLTFNTPAPNDGRCRAPSYRAVDDAQVARCRHCDARRLCGTGVGPGNGARRRLAWRIDHDRRGSVHGILQRVVTTIYPAFERARISVHRNGGRGGSTFRSRCSDRTCSRACEFRRARMDCRNLSRRFRGCAGVHPLGLGVTAHDPDAGRKYDDGQPDRRRIA